MLVTRYSFASLGWVMVKYLIISIFFGLDLLGSALASCSSLGGTLRGVLRGTTLSDLIRRRGVGDSRLVRASSIGCLLA